MKQCSAFLEQLDDLTLRRDIGLPTQTTSMRLPLSTEQLSRDTVHKRTFYSVGESETIELDIVTKSKGRKAASVTIPENGQVQGILLAPRTDAFLNFLFPRTRRRRAML